MSYAQVEKQHEVVFTSSLFHAPSRRFTGALCHSKGQEPNVTCNENYIFLCFLLLAVKSELGGSCQGSFTSLEGSGTKFGNL